MATINHCLIHREEEILRVNRKEQLDCIKTVLRVLPNISGIGVIRVGEMDGLTDDLKDGLITVVELNRHELTEEEIEAISHLGIQLPLMSRLGTEIEVERLNLDSDDIKILRKL